MPPFRVDRAINLRRASPIYRLLSHERARCKHTRCMCGNQNRRETCLITGIVDGKFDAITGLIFEAERKQALYLLTVPVGRVAVFRLMLDIGADYSLYFSLRDCDRG